MNARKMPISRHLWAYVMLNELRRNASVSRKAQYWHASVADGLVRYPPAKLMNGSKYCEQVCPLGGSSVTNSEEEQFTSNLPTAEKRTEQAYE